MRGVRRGNSGSENADINKYIESNSITRFLIGVIDYFSLVPNALDNRADICGVEEISSIPTPETFSHKTHFFR